MAFTLVVYGLIVRSRCKNLIVLMKTQEKLILLLVAAVALFAGQIYYQITSEAHYSELVQVYQPERELKPFSLIDENNDAFTNESLEGKWSLVFLGYLSCPDICPMTMAKLSGLLPKLNENSAKPVQVLFVSVDPKRDLVDKRQKYVNYFNPEIKGLGAEHKALFPFVTNLGLMYSVPSDDEEEYFVDHSASIALINPSGKIAAMFKPEVAVGQIPTVNTKVLLADFKTLVN